MSKNLESKANGLFAQFCERLAKVDLKLAAAVPAAIGVVATMYGIGLEVQGQSDLLQHGGLMAVDAYKNAMQANPIDSVTEYARLAFAGKLPSFGGNAQGIGITVAVVAPAISTASVLLARGFEKAKAFLADRLEQVQQLRSDPPRKEVSARLSDAFGGGSMVLKGIQSKADSKPGFFVAGREKGVPGQEPLDDSSLRAKPR